MTAIPLPTTQEQDAERYRAEQSAAAEAFRLAHPTEWRRMNHDVMGQWTGKLGSWEMLSRAMTRYAATAGGFPSFAVWLNRLYPRKDAA